MKKFSSLNSFLLKKIKVSSFYNFMVTSKFSDKMKDKEVAEEKFYFDKEESK